MTEVEILQTPTKSESDKNEYRLIKLSNGLRALLIKSSKTTLDKEEPAAVSLIVNVGFFDDPKSAQGLAHFLEHLLFLGSEKYQGESEFDSFLGLHSGYSNALTRDESTEYYLTVSEENLAEALDRFAQNLMSPLLKMSAMQREREAVDSEFQGSFFNDRARKFNLFQTFLNENHPASFEKTGNLKTLKDVISEEELHGEIVKLHQKYVAQKMCLVLQSTKELDQQQEIVAKNFSAIKAGEREISEPQPLENIFKPEFSSKMAFMKPKTTLKALSITWALPPMQKYYKSAPLTYIKKIFQNTSEGSLSRYLESNQLITSMRFDDNSCSMYSSPELYLEITDLGSKNIETILKAIFSYLLMIRNTSTNDHLRLYNDFKDLQEIQFKYRTKKDASQNVERFGDTMLIVDDVDILRGSSMFQKFDEKLITDTINRLNQRKFNIIIIDDSHGHFPKIQQQYDVEYDLVDFPQSFQKLWNERKIDPKFFLERSNPFKATNFEIHSNESESMVRSRIKKSHLLSFVSFSEISSENYER